MKRFSQSRSATDYWQAFVLCSKKFGMNARHFEKIEDLLDALDTTLNADTMLLVKDRASCAWNV